LQEYLKTMQKRIGIGHAHKESARTHAHFSSQGYGGPPRDNHVDYDKERVFLDSYGKHLYWGMPFYTQHGSPF